MESDNTLTQSIFGKFKHRKSFIWWEIRRKLIFNTFFVYLSSGCLEIISGHPKLRYTENLLKINFRLISHQINDFLYLNIPNMDCESYLTTFRYALSTTHNKKYAQCNGVNARAYFWLFLVLRVYLKVAKGLSQSIFGKYRYSKLVIWWEISWKLIFKSFFVYLNLGCLEIISGHPKLRYTKKLLKIYFWLISHQIKDFLYMNFPNMDFESPLTTLRYALSITNK